MDTPRQIAQCRAQLAALEQKLVAELAELPAQYGYASVEDFIAAVKKSAGRRPAPTRKAGSKITASTGFKKRVRVTPEMEVKVKAMVETGKSTGQEIADAIGVSLATVQNLKHKLGLSKRRNRRG